MTVLAVVILRYRDVFYVMPRVTSERTAGSNTRA